MARFNQEIRALSIRDAARYFERHGYGVDWVKIEGSQAYIRIHGSPRIGPEFHNSHIMGINLRRKESLYQALKEAREVGI